MSLTTAGGVVAFIGRIYVRTYVRTLYAYVSTDVFSMRTLYFMSISGALRPHLGRASAVPRPYIRSTSAITQRYFGSTSAQLHLYLSSTLIGPRLNLSPTSVLAQLYFSPSISSALALL